MTNFHMGFISDVVGRSPNLLSPSLPTALFLLLLHMGLGAQLEMRINKEVCLESPFCYDKSVLEERIEKPIGISLTEKIIGNNPRCFDCEAKGAVHCTTCSGSGLYIDSVLESQGILVKVRCLGCGGSGNIMCSECGGRGHLG